MESQKTCKLFGAIRAVLGIKDAVPLIHGPVGCAYHIKYLLSVRSHLPIRILATNMDQNDVVFGAEAKLEQEIIKTDKNYSPNLIVVLTSCASSIIGEDIGRVIKKTKNHIKSEIIGINAGGFEGTQIDGYQECILTLIDLMDEPKPRGDHINSLNLVSQFRGGPDLDHIKAYLNKLNINLNCVLTSGSTLKEVKNASNASLNISMCEASGIVPCETMQEKFGIPFLSPNLPIGVSSTSNFYSSICEFFQVNYVFKDEERKVIDEIKPYLKHFKDKKVAIIAGSSRAIALTEFICELGMSPVLISLDFVGRDTMRNLSRTLERNQVTPSVLSEPEYHEVLSCIGKLELDLILGGLGEIGISKRVNVPLLDVMHAQEVTMGFEGALNLSSNIKMMID